MQPLVHEYVDPEGPHTGVPPEQPAPHAEQFVAVPRLVAQPAPALAQSANPAAHWYEQWPAAQETPVALTFRNFAQLAPHAPQLLASVPDTSTQLPPQSF